jgi:hypothetical protein
MLNYVCLSPTVIDTTLEMDIGLFKLIIVGIQA